MAATHSKTRVHWMARLHKELDSVFHIDKQKQIVWEKDFEDDDTYQWVFNLNGVHYRWLLEKRTLRIQKKSKPAK